MERERAIEKSSFRAYINNISFSFIDQTIYIWDIEQIKKVKSFLI